MVESWGIDVVRGLNVKLLHPAHVELSWPVHAAGTVIRSSVFALLTSSNQYPGTKGAGGFQLIGPFPPDAMLLIKREPAPEEPPELPPLDELLVEAPPDELLEPPLDDPLDELLPEPPLDDALASPLLLLLSLEVEEHPARTPTALRPTTVAAVRRSFVAMNAPKHLS
jgi:hypothetical protein